MKLCVEAHRWDHGWEFFAKRLRAAGLSTTDSAAILGVSRGRVSQLVG